MCIFVLTADTLAGVASVPFKTDTGKKIIKVRRA